MNKLKQRKKVKTDWIRIYQAGGYQQGCSALQRWIRRQSEEGLGDRSRRPHRLARQKWDDEVNILILDIRDTHCYDKIRTCSHLLLHYQINIPPSTVARVLEKYNMKLLKH